MNVWFFLPSSLPQSPLRGKGEGGGVVGGATRRDKGIYDL